jgi:tRNA-2-methylthio-N6-dimethylallyladenosine synthase
MSLIAEVEYAQAYSFKYSPRPGTPAAIMDDQIAPEIMDERLQQLQALLGEQQHAFNRSVIGQQCDILLERSGKYEGQLIGKSPWLQSAHVSGEGLKIGDMVRVQINDAGYSSITGEILMKSPIMIPVKTGA